MFSSGDRAQDQRIRLWQHSVGCAVVARSVADHVEGVDKDEAFLAGVFHDVGKLLFYDIIPDEYSEVDASFIGGNLVEEEEFLFGTTHEKVGLASADAWELPNEIKTAIGWHHRPEIAENCPTFAQVIHTANSLARHWGVGSEATPQEDLTDVFASNLQLTEELLETVENEARRAFDETMEVSV